MLKIIEIVVENRLETLISLKKPSVTVNLKYNQKCLKLGLQVLITNKF